MSKISSHLSYFNLTLTTKFILLLLMLNGLMINKAISQEKFKIICNSIKEKNLKLIITPFDEKSVDNAVKQDVDILKIASCSASDWPLIEKIASKKIARKKIL